MNMQEGIDLQGRLHCQLLDRQGNIVQSFSEKNKIVLDGRDLVVKLFSNQAIDPISHIAVGTDSTGVLDGDTSLGSEIFRKAINTIDFSIDIVTETISGIPRKKLTISTELDYLEGNGQLTEAGVFNAPTGGIMYNRVTFPVINKSQAFKLNLVWVIIF